MSERKVLNKYYPPDFDPSKIPRLKGQRNHKFCVRLMAPCNMRCTTCGEYIYKGKKFNSRKEDVDEVNYLGIRVYRFYIKCTRCLSEISFRTDPENTDYVIEAGATRNFQALKLAEEQAEREEQERLEEEKSNPMKLLEKRTKQSKHEMEVIEALEELRELNQRQAVVDYDSMLEKKIHEAQAERIQQEEDDERLIRSVFSKTEVGTVKRILDDDSGSDDEKTPAKVIKSVGAAEKPTDLLTGSDKSLQKKEDGERSIGTLSKNYLLGLIKPKIQLKKHTGSTSQLQNCSEVEHPRQKLCENSQNLLPTTLPSSSLDLQSDPPQFQKAVNGEMEDKEGSGKESNIVDSDVNHVNEAFQIGLDTSRHKSETILSSKSCKATGLSLLGAYSSVSSDSDSD